MPPAVRNLMGDDSFDDFVDIYLYGLLAAPATGSDG